jgi:NADH-quinone oxidoreductase subunit L
MDDMGGLRKKMPITFWTFLIATLALSGVPPFSGFFSKDAILASALQVGMARPAHMVVFVIMLLSAGITAFYMLRLVYMTFSGTPRDKGKYEHAHESPWTMTVPLIILAALSIGSWGWFSDLIVKPALPGQGLSHSTAHDSGHLAHNIAMVSSIVVVALGVLLATLVYYWRKISAQAWGQKLRPVYNLLWNKYYFDEMYRASFIAGTLAVSRIAAIFDIRVIDGLVNGAATAIRRLSDVKGRIDLKVIDGAVNGLARFVALVSMRLRGLQSGQIQGYILFALFAVIILFLLQSF